MSRKYKLTTFLHKGITAEQEGMPGFQSVLAFLSSLYAAWKCPTERNDTPGLRRTGLEEFFHPGLKTEWWEGAAQGFKASSRAEMHIFPNSPTGVTVQVMFWDGKKEDIDRRITFNYHLDRDQAGAGYFGTDSLD